MFQTGLKTGAFDLDPQDQNGFKLQQFLKKLSSTVPRSGGTGFGFGGGGRHLFLQKMPPLVHVYFVRGRKLNSLHCTKY